MHWNDDKIFKWLWPVSSPLYIKLDFLELMILINSKTLINTQLLFTFYRYGCSLVLQQNFACSLALWHDKHQASKLRERENWATNSFPSVNGGWTKGFWISRLSETPFVVSEAVRTAKSHTIRRFIKLCSLSLQIQIWLIKTPINKCLVRQWSSCGFRWRG